MSAVWKPLLPLALMGTDRQAALPAWSGEINSVIARAAAQSSDPATAALRAAGVLASCSLARAQGHAWTAALPAPARDDVLPEAGGAMLPTLIAWAFREGPERLHHEICLALAGAAYRLPARLLPTALDLGRRSVALRRVLAPVLSERGRWLAAMNEEWQYATGAIAAEADEATWSEGSIEQRRAFLARERAVDPQAANARLQQALGEMSAKERVYMVGVLADGLSINDEALLEALRADRSRDVRTAALALFLRLPESGFTRRAMTRMAALLKFERGLIRKRWTVDAPEAMSEDWKADNLDTPRPAQESLGERAWLLYQLARQVPLSWWTAHLDMSPQALHQWANGTDWHEALMRAWRDVLVAAPDEAWCNAFLDNWPETKLRDDPATIVALLPRASREHYWRTHLDGVTIATLGELVRQMLAACPLGETLSLPLSRALVEILMSHAVSEEPEPALTWLLAPLACVLHGDVIEPLARWPQRDQDKPSFSAALQAVTQIVATRHALRNLSTSKTR